jgi:hypothetical protein
VCAKHYSYKPVRVFFWGGGGGRVCFWTRICKYAIYQFSSSRFCVQEEKQESSVVTQIWMWLQGRFSVALNAEISLQTIR